jgi:protein-disulfide isomerase
MANARNAKSAREKAALLRQEEDRRQARRRNVTVAVSVVAVLAVVIGLTVLVRTLNNEQKAKEAAATAPPRNVVTNAAGASGYQYGKDSAKVSVTVYEDFICPACKNFENTNQAALHKYADEGKIKILYSPVGLLDDYSTTGYSTRAAAAAAAVLDVAPDKFMAYHDALFTAQPAEGGPGLPNTQLVDLAVQAGVDKTAVEQAITTQKFAGWVKKGYDHFTKTKKFSSTPTILIGDTKLDDYDPAKVTAAIENALKG